MVESSQNTPKPVRNFPENGIKRLLENPKNVRDLLALTGTKIIQWIDFDRLALEPTVFIKCDFHEARSDLVFKAPLRVPGHPRLKRRILVYLLIEHQSEPSATTPLNVLDYVVQIYRRQQREWKDRYRSRANIRFDPVLPVVFYTGRRRWEKLGKLVDFVELGKFLEAQIPGLEPIFLSLRDMPAKLLESQGGFFGWVLRLLQRCKGRPRVFQRLLRRVVRHLETMPTEEQNRWGEFLFYIKGMIYHYKDLREMPSLDETINASVRTDEHRRELIEMGKTYAQVLKEEGREQGEIRALRSTLLRQLQRRFGKLPQEIVQRIQSTDDSKTLNSWLERFATASTLEEMEI
jgi:hypothetical protein